MDSGRMISIWVRKNNVNNKEGKGLGDYSLGGCKLFEGNNRAGIF